jgi:hypothetical protein
LILLPNLLLFGDFNAHNLVITIDMLGRSLPPLFGKQIIQFLNGTFYVILWSVCFMFFYDLCILFTMRKSFFNGLHMWTEMKSKEKVAALPVCLSETIYNETQRLGGHFVKGITLSKVPFNHFVESGSLEWRLSTKWCHRDLSINFMTFDEVICDEVINAQTQRVRVAWSN